MALPALTDAFPVCADLAYLNAGTCGPVPRAASEAMLAEIHSGTSRGRTLAYYDRLGVLAGAAREAWSSLLNAPPSEIALTAGATDGIARTLAMRPWHPGDVVVISDEEHPGVTGPVQALQRRHGVQVRVAAWDALAASVADDVSLVVTSHVGWLSGRVMDLEAVGRAGVPVIVDGAQSTGAIPVDLGDLRGMGVVAYASPGQKWTCGPVGTGALWVDPAWAPDAGHGVWPSYENLADPASGLAAVPWPDARRWDSPSLSAELLAGSVAALGTLAAAGWAQVHEAATDRAATLAAQLEHLGARVLTRGPSTLVTWEPQDPAAFLLAADQAGVVVRGFAGQPLVRASVGAWTTADDLSRLVQIAVDDLAAR